MACLRNLTCFRLNSSFNIWTPLFSRGIQNFSQESEILRFVKKNKPLPPFLMFVAEKEAEFSRANNTILKKNKMVIASQLWNKSSSDEKAVYYDQYKKNMQTYYDKLYDYFKEVPDLKKLNELEEEVFKKVIKVQQLKKKKPKRPLNDYLMFIEDQNSTKLTVQEKAKSWLNLDDMKKQYYRDKARELLLNYKEELEKWEKEMLEQGHYLLVRKRVKNFEKTAIIE